MKIIRRWRQDFSAFIYCIFKQSQKQSSLAQQYISPHPSDILLEHSLPKGTRASFLLEMRMNYESIEEKELLDLAIFNSTR